MTSFFKVDPNGSDTEIRVLETTYPDGEKDRVEFRSSFGNPGLGIPDSEPAAPGGMQVTNGLLFLRNTYYWSKQAYAYGFDPKDYTKAKIYHWVHISMNPVFCSSILESVKEPLEGRVWYDYGGQTTSYGALLAGNSNKPAHIGRVLDDGSTQLYTYEYNDFGNVTKSIDPVGRTFSYIYAENGIDLLEVRQTRGNENELLIKRIYNDKHLPLKYIDAAGQETVYTYNDRGQLLTITNSLGETITYEYDANGYRISQIGPLGETDKTTWTYDSPGRIATTTDTSGYTLRFEYDALDRPTKLSYPDGTSNQFFYTLLDRTKMRDRTGAETSFEFNNVRQTTKRIDRLGRVTLFQWCKCGALKSLTDPLGRTTVWRHDIQGRIKIKEYPDGSRIAYLYETATSRLRQRIDAKLQVAQYSYNHDNTLNRRIYFNTAVETSAVGFDYDQNYNRITSMTDGTGTTHYSYVPITPTPTFGAGKLAAISGPFPNAEISFQYDELGRRGSTTINGVTSRSTFDPGGRLFGVTNPLGIFNYTYDGNSSRVASLTYPNGQKTEYRYGTIEQDLSLQQIINTVGSGAAPDLVSQFAYERDVPEGRIRRISSQFGHSDPIVYGFFYDSENQLTAAKQLGGALQFAVGYSYSYDLAGNRTGEVIETSNPDAPFISRVFWYNALNQLTTFVNGAPVLFVGEEDASYEWDAEQRLRRLNSGNQILSSRMTVLGVV